MEKARLPAVLLASSMVLVGVVFSAQPSRAVTSMPAQTVPVYVPADGGMPPVGGPIPGETPIPEETAVPTASPPVDVTPAPGDTKIDPTFKVPKSIFYPLLTGLLQKITDQIVPFLNQVPDLGWFIYTRLAAISVLIGVIQSVVLGEFSIAALVKNLYWRIVEAGIWRIIIQYTWSGLPGGFGWFSGIIMGFVSIGAAIGGIDATRFDGTTFSLQVLPGTIADLGVGLFSSIMGMVSIGHGGLFDVIGKAMDGTMIGAACLWMFGLLSGLFAMFVCGAIAFKYLWTIVKVYVYGCMSFIQGFGGSRRLTGIAGSFGNAAIVLGAELCVTIILVGIMWHVIVGLVQALGFAQALSAVDVAGPVPGGTVTGHLADLSYTAAALAVLDLVLTLWAYAMWRVPKDIAELLSGKIQVQNGELRQAFQSSPFLPAKIAGHGMNVIEQGGTKGAGAAAGTAVAPIGQAIGKVANMAALGAAAGSGNGEGSGAIASGAVKGFLLGGPPGAVAGAIGSMVMSKLSGGGSSEGGSFSSGSEDEIENDERGNPDLRDAEGASSQGAPRSSSAPRAGGPSESVDEGGLGEDADSEGGGDAGVTAKRRRVLIEDDVTENGGSGDVGDDSSTPPQKNKTRRTQVDDELVTAMRAMTQALNANSGGSAGQAQTMAAAAAGGSRGASRTSSGFDPMAEMSNNMSIGKMVMYKAMYAQGRSAPTPPPHGDTESASLNIPLTFGK